MRRDRVFSDKFLYLQPLSEANLELILVSGDNNNFIPQLRTYLKGIRMGFLISKKSEAK